MEIYQNDVNTRQCLNACNNNGFWCVSIHFNGKSIKLKCKSVNPAFVSCLSTPGAYKPREVYYANIDVSTENKTGWFTKGYIFMAVHCLCRENQFVFSRYLLCICEVHGLAQTSYRVQTLTLLANVVCKMYATLSEHNVG